MLHNQKIEKLLLSKLPNICLSSFHLASTSLLFTSLKEVTPPGSSDFLRTSSLSLKYPKFLVMKFQEDIMHSKAFDLILKDNDNAYKVHVKPTLIDCEYSWYEFPIECWLLHKNSIDWQIESCELVDNLHDELSLLVIQ
jgi:hypothetical protein